MKAATCQDYLSQKIHIYSNSELWWHSKVTVWPINGAFVSNELMGNFMSDKITHSPAVKSEVNLLHFLQPPNKADPEYVSWINARQKNFNKYTVQGDFATQQNYRSSNLQTEMFTGGLNEELGHIHTAIANFLCMLEFIYVPQALPIKRPEIVQYLHKILQLTNKPSFHEWYRQSIRDNPWIPHILVTMTQCHPRVCEVGKESESSGQL